MVKTVRRISSLAASIMVLAGCSAQNAAVDVENPAPGKAVILLAVTDAEPRSTLQLSPYDPARHVLTSTPLSGFDTFDLSDVSDQGFVWKQVDPGTYVFASFTHQNQWALCFAGQTQAFTVQAGQKLYLGRLDTAVFEQALESDVAVHGNGTMRSGVLSHYFDGIPPVRTDMAKLPLNPDGSISVSSSRSVDAVDDAVFTPAVFKAGYTLYGARVCGGYGRQ
jgi:hypothetical protein